MAVKNQNVLDGRGLFGPKRLPSKRSNISFTERYVASDEELSSAAEQYLLTDRKFTRAYIKQAGITSYTEQLANGDDYQVLIPYTDIDGQPINYGRSRLLNARPGQQKFDADSKTGAYFYYPRITKKSEDVWRAVAKDVSQDICITEGEFKAARLAQQGIYCIGLGGVWNFTVDNKPIDEFKNINWSGRRVHLIYDADCQTNIDIQTAAMRLSNLLDHLGADVRLCIVPDLGDGKSGIDDYIVARGIKAARKLISDSKRWNDLIFRDFGIPRDLRADEREYANLFVRLHGHELRFVTGENVWIRKQGHLWIRDADNKQVLAMVNSMIENIYQDGLFAAATPEERKKRMDSISKMSNARRYKGIAEIAGGMLLIKSSQLDSDPMLLGTQNGILDLRDGELLDDISDDTYVTRSVAVEFDPSADCKKFKKFLLATQSKAEAEDVVGLLQRYFGYVLTAKTSEQAMLMLVGTGQTGKSTLVDLMLRITGDYGSLIQTRSLMAAVGNRQTQSGPTPEIVALKDLRLATAKESSEGDRIDEAQLKAIVDTGQITGRPLHGKPITFPITFKLVLHTNHGPIIKHDDDAVWRRLIVVEFNKKIPNNKRILDFDQKLFRDEAPGILNWMLAGLQAWQVDGLQVPESVKANRRNYRESMDWLADFLEDCCVVDRAKQVATTDLYDEYVIWAKERGMYVESNRAFGRYLNQRGHKTVKRGKGKRMVRGLTIYFPTGKKRKRKAKFKRPKK